MALLTQAQKDAELQRKKNMGELPSDPANNAAYNKLTPLSASQAGVGGAAAGAIAGLPGGVVPTSPFIGPTLTGDRPQVNNPPISASAASAGTNSNTNQYGGVGNGSYGPPSPAAAPTTGTTTKTDNSYVPFISGNVDPVNGGNTTEYRAPREGDTGVGVTPPPSAAPPPVVYSPVSASQVQQSTPDYAAIAAARTAAALARKGTIAQQQKAAADASYNQQTLRTNDTRTLQDFQKSNSVNPFTDGKQTWDKGLIGRERTQADADASAALATQKGNIDQLLADYQDATAEEQVRIADELQRADRAYNLDLAKFNQDQSNFDKTYNQNQQQIDYSQDPSNPNNYGQSLANSLKELEIGNYTAEQKQKATLFEQQVKSGQMSNEAAEYNLKQLKDPNSNYNQAAAIDLQLKQLDLKNAPEQARLQIMQLQKQIAEIGKVHTQPQSAADQAADQVKLAVANKQIADIAKGIYPGDKADKPTTLDPKESSNNYDIVFEDIGTSLNLKEALDLVEQNASYLTKSDYDKAKEAAYKKFEVKKDASAIPYLK